MTPQKAWEAAVKVRTHAHAPYSRFHVGAALKLKGKEELCLGCNVENSSYGGTVCAERNAFFAAVAKYGSQNFEPEYLVLVTGSEKVDSPCGFCLQVLSEFASADFEIHLSNLQGIQHSLKLKDLLPRPFDKSNLPEKV